MSRHLPLFIDLSDRKVVIFGGGSVGERKATLFSKHAKVVVVSREFTDGLKSLEGRVDLVQVDEIREEVVRSWVAGAFLVIPATSSATLNRMVARVAVSERALVNSVDEVSEVIVPSIIDYGEITIAISTSASSPALSRYIREKLERVITPEFVEMARLQKELRRILKRDVKSQRERREILWEVLNDDAIWEALKESHEKAWRLAKRYVTKRDVAGS
ncbi:Precorrin-2 dehydrogenase [Candidatus Methanoperedenaceae archaeon GB50]|nr:MAG: Precorrin-2 dehydrogenase [Candidatus Methanoperedenaceae archaeon GB50]CAD7773351.1 Precorrin-2 dehydrogenase [Candidatus Methanoperedenaceae archaeon GB50]